VEVFWFFFSKKNEALLFEKRSKNFSSDISAADVCRRHRFDRVPPGRPHHPFPGDHYHYVEANMRPDGKCFWNGSLVTDTPLVGALPSPEPFQ
jgi:hypothetical protein